MVEKTSDNLSFVGWKFSKWFTGNWSTIKEILKVGVPFFASTFFLDPMYQQFIGTVIGKFILDCGEFYFKKVTL